MSELDWNNPVYHMSQSGNSSGYDQTLREKNMQLTELQFYINNITSCPGIVDLFICKYTGSSVQHFHKCSTLLQVYYIQITQQDQPIYIPKKGSHPISPIETIDIVPPTPHISSYLTKYDLENRI